MSKSLCDRGRRVPAGGRSAFERACELHRQNRLAEAAELYELVLEETPSCVPALLVVGVRSHAVGDLGRSTELFRRAVELEPGNAAAHHNLAGALERQGRIDEAIGHFRAALAIDPRQADSHVGLGNALLSHGDLAGAVSCLRRAVELKPHLARAWLDLAAPLASLGRFDDAAAAFRRGAELDAALAASRAADIYKHLGTSFADYGLQNEAILCMEKALQCRKGPIDEAERRAFAFNSLGLNAQHGGRLPEAQAWFKRALEVAPDDLAAFSNYAWCLQYGNSRSPQEAKEVAQTWAAKWSCLEKGRRKPHRGPADGPCGRPEPGQGSSDARNGFRVAPPDPDEKAPHNTVAGGPDGRRLRIGYLSPDFWDRPPAYCIEPLLESHDRTRFEVFLYSASSTDDHVSKRLRRLADGWRDISRLSDDEAAGLIEADAVDILVDLAGHTEGNRVGVLARKPSPVQAEWLGYYATTGLPQIDYFVCDPMLIPPEEECLYVEKPMRLAGRAFCFKPPTDEIPITALPARRNGFVTFGSHAYLAKVVPEVVRVWSEVLLAVPGSRLVMNRQALAAPRVQAWYAKLFADSGVDPSRVTFQSTWTRNEHLASLSALDVVLDTFPFNGGTSTYEALWMGLPVVTMAAPRMVGHFGEAILHRIGRPEWVARTPEEFVAKACRLASDLDGLDDIRANLRAELANSPLCDARAFTLELEAAFERMIEERIQASR